MRFLLNFGWLGWRRWWCSGSRRRFGWPLFFSTDPTFHADLAVNRVGLSKTVINWRAQRVEWNFSLPVPFGTRNLSAVQSTGGTKLYPLCAKIHCRLHGFLHRAPVSNAAFNL